MSTITIRRTRTAAPQQASGMAGAFGASIPGEYTTEEVECSFEAEEVALDLSVLFVRAFGGEPGIIEFIDEPSQTETGIVYTEADAAAQAASGLEETEVDGKTAEDLGLHHGAAYYITTFDDEHTLAIYARGYFEDRDGSWGLDDVKSFRFAAPAVD